MRTLIKRFVPWSRGAKERFHAHTQGFSLMEILVAVAIIGIMVGLLLPVVNEVIKRGEGQKALTEIQSIKIAIDAYYKTYGKLPVPAADQGIADTYYSGSGASSKPIIKALIGEDPVLNPNKTVFLKLPTGDLDGTFVDPWGEQYGVKMDNNYDDAIQVSSLGGKWYKVCAVVKSDGMDQAHSTGDDLWSVKK